MLHNDIYEKFKVLFPLYPTGASLWTPNEANSIRVRMDEHMQFIFTFNNNKDWRFETVESFTNSQ